MQCYHPRGYQIACDKCGTVFSHDNRTVFKTAYAVMETARQRGWKSLKSKPYDICPHCLKRV